jgi:hypothetical protein
MMADFREIGRIVRVQVQASSLKAGDGRRQHYDPSPLRPGNLLRVESDVVHGVAGDERWLDVHCAAHPESRNRGDGDMLSIGFTGHYATMRDRFGEHLLDGIAGENVLVEYDGVLELSDIERGLRLGGEDGRVLTFPRITVAHPCVEFSRFCLADDAAPGLAIKETLQFLDGGRRGFYCYIDGGLPQDVCVDDRLLARL